MDKNYIACERNNFNLLIHLKSVNLGFNVKLSSAEVVGTFISYKRNWVPQDNHRRDLLLIILQIGFSAVSCDASATWITEEDKSVPWISSSSDRQTTFPEARPRKIQSPRSGTQTPVIQSIASVGNFIRTEMSSGFLMSIP